MKRHSVQSKIKHVHISQLNEWEKNPRLISQGQYRALAESVRRYGLVDPPIVDQNYGIVRYQRAKVLRDQGLKPVPVVKLQLSKRDLIFNLAEPVGDCISFHPEEGPAQTE